MSYQASVKYHKSFNKTRVKCFLKNVFFVFLLTYDSVQGRDEENLVNLTAQDVWNKVQQKARYEFSAAKTGYTILYLLRICLNILY